MSRRAGPLQSRGRPVDRQHELHFPLRRRQSELLRSEPVRHGASGHARRKILQTPARVWRAVPLVVRALTRVVTRLEAEILTRSASFCSDGERRAARFKRRSRGADGRTRTGTACATAPSRQRVYQFHHIGTEKNPLVRRRILRFLGRVGGRAVGTTGQRGYIGQVSRRRIYRRRLERRPGFRLQDRPLQQAWRRRGLPGAR